MLMYPRRPNPIQGTAPTSVRRQRDEPRRWAALLAAMVVASVVAGLAAQALDLSVPVLAIAAAALVLALVVAADRRYFWSLYIGYFPWTHSEASDVAALANRLRDMGMT